MEFLLKYWSGGQNFYVNFRRGLVFHQIYENVFAGDVSNEIFLIKL